ncbi:hypothetical protein RUM44_008208 [Polyplax serrata]|uniref:Uncharacterized protein n=1 Tax=Polyplax serrata TaxID=468196 RepID=A0ABR1B7V2_POLSC
MLIFDWPCCRRGYDVNFAEKKKYKQCNDNCRHVGLYRDLRNSIVLSGKIALGNDSLEERSIRATPNWSETAVNGDHLWSATSASGDFCYVGENDCTKEPGDLDDSDK